MTTSSAVPGTSPLIVRNSKNTTLNAQKVTSHMSLRPGSGSLAIRAAKRQPTHSSSSAGAQIGSAGQCGRLAPMQMPALQIRRDMPVVLRVSALILPGRTEPVPEGSRAGAARRCRAGSSGRAG